MPSTAGKVGMGAIGAVAMARSPKLRRVTFRAGKRPAKLAWRVRKIVIRRKARAQIRRLSATGRNVVLFASIYGPMAAEAFGLVEAPKPRRRAPAFAAGVVVGAGALYVLLRNNRVGLDRHSRAHART